MSSLKLDTVADYTKYLVSLTRDQRVLEIGSFLWTVTDYHTRPIMIDPTGITKYCPTNSQIIAAVAGRYIYEIMHSRFSSEPQSRKTPLEIETWARLVPVWKNYQIMPNAYLKSKMVAYLMTHNPPDSDESTPPVVHNLIQFLSVDADAPSSPKIELLDLSGVKLDELFFEQAICIRGFIRARHAASRDLGRTVAAKATIAASRTVREYSSPLPAPKRRKISENPAIKLDQRDIETVNILCSLRVTPYSDHARFSFAESQVAL